MAADDELLNLFLGNVLDVRAAGVQHLNLDGISIKTGDLVARFGKAQSQRQADVAAANDSYSELGAFEKFRSTFDGHGLRITPVV